MVSVLVDLPQPSHRLIIEAVCQYFDITVQELFSITRSNTNAYRRAIACYLAKEELQLDNTSIAEYLGMKRKTVGYNVERIEREKRIYCHVTADLRKVATSYRILQKIQDEWLNSQSSN